jgi:hypothetical protein
MVDETNIHREMEWFYEHRAKAAMSSLQKRGINAHYAPSRNEAFSAVMEMIPEGATVVRGDSITLEQIGVVDELRKRSHNKQNIFVDPLARTPEGFFIADQKTRMAQQREAFRADVFLTGVNAVTLDGKLVSIDAYGNRVAPMIFGPDQVIVVAGANKIVKDTNEALERTHQIAAPLNAQRHYLKHRWHELADLPCVRTGRCANCNHEWKICLMTVIIEGVLPWAKGRMNVVLIGEALGL